MARRRSSRRVPRAHVDPLTCAADALAVVELIITRPLRHETITLFLDAQRRGCGASVVGGTVSPDTVLDVVGAMADAVVSTTDVDGFVVVSVRPGDSLIPADLARLDELRLAAADHGIELIEWIILGRRGAEYPRTLTDSPDPWAP